MKYLFPAAALLSAAGVMTAVTPTPTPVPRLTGGFGRPRATPLPSVAGSGQSQSSERGKAGLTINNRSLVTNPEKGRVSTSKVAPPKTATPQAPSPSSAAGDDGPSAHSPVPSGGSAGNEAEWREAVHRARQRVEDARARVAELDAATRKLENDFYSWDDGQYRDRVIKPAWDRTREQLEEARRELAAAERDLADLPEKARKAGALPGWLRE